jgi:hypothetical protein
VIVRCKATKPTTEEATVASIDFGGLANPYAVTIGKLYLVLGLVFPRTPSLLGTDGAITYTENDWYILQAPLAMFEVIDPRASAKWILRRSQMGDLCLWPPSFFDDYYHDLLSDGDPETVRDFQRVYAELREESGFAS